MKRIGFNDFETMPSKNFKKITSNEHFSFYGGHGISSLFKLRVSISGEQYCSEQFENIIESLKKIIVQYEKDIFQMKYAKPNWINSDKDNRFSKGGQITIYLKNNCDYCRLCTFCSAVSDKLQSSSINPGDVLGSDVQVNSYVHLTQDKYTKPVEEKRKNNVTVYCSHDSSKRRQLYEKLITTDIYKILTTEPKPLTPTQEFSDFSDSDNENKTTKPEKNRSNIVCPLKGNPKKRKYLL